MKRGLLLINLGTPSGNNVTAVRAYLREFLADKRVINLPTFFRYLLIYIFILPFRSKKSAKAYQAIWTAEGSPLLYHSQKLATQIQEQLSSEYKVMLGMRYGSPSIKKALDALKDCTHITVLPLYPQYSSAATGSTIEKVMRIIAPWEVIPSVNIIADFYQHPAYLKAQAEMIKRHLNDSEYLLFSYHGLPERQLHHSGCNPVCLQHCADISSVNSGCYKAQCNQTTSFLAQALNLSPSQYSSSFQSRLGALPWIKPYTDEILIELAQKGIKKLAIACPSFVTDCLETLEEIGIRAKKQWLELGGEELNLIPCMNEDPKWIKAVCKIAMAYSTDI